MKKLLTIIGLLVVGYLCFRLIFPAPDTVFSLGESLLRSSAEQKGRINLSNKALDTIGDYKYILFAPSGVCDIKLVDSLEDITIKIAPDDVSPESICKDEHTLLLQKSFIEIVSERDPILYFIESKERGLDQSIKYKLERVSSYSGKTHP